MRKTFGGAILMVVEHHIEHRAEAQHLLVRLGVPDVPETDLGVWEYRQLNPSLIAPGGPGKRRRPPHHTPFADIPSDCTGV